MVLISPSKPIFLGFDGSIRMSSHRNMCRTTGGIPLIIVPSQASGVSDDPGSSNVPGSSLTPLATSGVDAIDAVLLQPVPEDGDAVEHLPAALEKLLAVEVGVKIRLLQLLHHVAGVLALDAVVPGEERQPQVRDARLLDLQQAVLDLL